MGVEREEAVVALIKCKECGAQVSTKAEACPSCGAKVKKPLGCLGWTLLLIVMLPVGLIVLGSFSRNGDQSRSAGDRKPSPAQYKYGAREFVKAILKDPESAEFRNEFVGAKGVPCGEVNAKNGFGGYTGFKRFVSAGKEATFIETADNAKEFDNLWKELCAR